MRNKTTLLAFPLITILTTGFVENQNFDNGAKTRWYFRGSSRDSFRISSNVLDRQSNAIRYFLDPSAYSSENREAELNALRASFGQWESIPHTEIEFQDAGLISGEADVNLDDNTVMVFWTKHDTLVADGMVDLSGGLAQAFIKFSGDGTIIEGDIAFNGLEKTWTADINEQDSQKNFIEGVALHEIGHLLGLSHTPVGGATMLSQQDSQAPKEQVQLSQDEVSYAQAIYPDPGAGATLPDAGIEGEITKDGLTPVFGASIILEDPHGNIVQGTVSEQDGSYKMPGVAPGSYNVRVVPLHPSTIQTTRSLVRGRDVSTRITDEGNFIFDAVDTAFLPLANQSVTLESGETLTRDFSVENGTPPFRIRGIQQMVGSDHNLVVISQAARSVVRGTQGARVGVFSPEIQDDATLEITGDGIAPGNTNLRKDLFADLDLLSVTIDVAPDATPGMRSFLLHQDNHTAYANGYLEILPQTPDANFDGLDDRFQRQFFPIFTAPEAAPEADPDNDGFSNEREASKGTDPTDIRSLSFNINEAKLTAAGTRLTWDSGPGKTYRVLRRSQIETDAQWEVVGTVTAASGPAGKTTEFLDTEATERIHFYRIEAALP